MTQDRKLSFVAILMAVAIAGLLCAFIVCVTTGCRSPQPGLTTNQIIISPAEYSMPALQPAQSGWTPHHSESVSEPREIVVEWDYPEDEPYRQSIVFRVYESEELLSDWRMMHFIAEVLSQSWTTRAEWPSAYWTVTASNTLTGLEGSPATR